MWQAYSSPVGLEVAASDLDAFKRKFYSERAKARLEGIYEFDSLQLITPPADVEGKWWIVRNANGGQIQPEEQRGTGEEKP